MSSRIKTGLHVRKKKDLRSGFLHLLDLKAHIFGQVLIALVFASLVGMFTFSNFIQDYPLSSAVPQGTKTVKFNLDGKITTYSTNATTVGQFLDQRKIGIGWGQTLFPSIHTNIKNNQMISLGTVKVATSIEETKIDFKTEKTNDYGLLEGESEVEQKGKKGRGQTTFLISKIGDFVVDKYQMEMRVIESPVDEIIRVGGIPKNLDPGDVTGIKAIGKNMLSDFGWSADQFGCLSSLWDKESGWNPSANNPFSGAYGIPQSLPGSKMASVGDDWRTNPATQIRWGLGYIRDRYGSPCGAWGHSEAVGWY